MIKQWIANTDFTLLGILIGWILVGIALAAGLWGIASFALWETDPAAWSQPVRTSLSFLWSVLICVFIWRRL